MKSISSTFRCAKPQPAVKAEDDTIAWARSVVTQPSPLISEYERGLIAALVVQAEAEAR